jgi:hypothetical protein
MLFLVLWAISAMLLLVGFGQFFYKLTGGAVVAYGILGAFGVERLLGSEVTCPARWRIGRQLMRALLAISTVLLFGTSLTLYSKMQYGEVPRVDTEMLEAVIRQENRDHIPVVLTDCFSGLVLAGLAATRVYSGHWAMTPHYSDKCNELAMAGFDERTGPAASIAEDRLREIVAKVHPNYVLVRRGAWAQEWLIAHHAASARTTGQRWTLLTARPMCGRSNP